MRDKKMTFDEAQDILATDWTRHRLGKDMLPDCLKGIPDEILHSVYVSGNSASGIPYYDPRRGSGYGVLTIEVVRHGTDGRALFKQDNYSGISGLMPDNLILLGPFRDSATHWMDELPDHLMNTPRIDSQWDWDL